MYMFFILTDKDTMIAAIKTVADLRIGKQI